MPFESDDKLLRRHALALRNGDLDDAAAAWERLAVNNFDRVNQTVKAFRFKPSYRPLPSDEHGSVASEAYLRVIAMGPGFDRTEAGRFYAALSTCVQHTCMDFGRKELRHDRRAAGSLDATYDPEGEATAFDGVLRAYDEELSRREDDADAAQRSRAEAEGLVAWAISQVSNDNYREMLELTWLERLSGEQIAQRLRIAMENVYARRSRGNKELERILRDLSP